MGQCFPQPFLNPIIVKNYKISIFSHGQRICNIGPHDSTDTASEVRESHQDAGVARGKIQHVGSGSMCVDPEKTRRKSDG